MADPEHLLQFFEGGVGMFFGEAVFVSDFSRDLGLGQSFCHN